MHLIDVIQHCCPYHMSFLLHLIDVIQHCCPYHMSFLQSELNWVVHSKMIDVQHLDIQGGASSPSTEACGS